MAEARAAVRRVALGIRQSCTPSVHAAPRQHADRSGDQCSNDAAAYIETLVEPVLTDLGWVDQPNDSALNIYLRSLAISAATSFGSQPAIDEAQRRFNAWRANSSSTELPTGLEYAVFRSVVAWGGEAGYNDVLDVYQTSTLATRKVRSLRALAAARTPALLQRALDYSLSSAVRKQDTVGLVDSVARNPFGRMLAWNFVSDNWATFDSRYGSGGFAIQSLVETVSSQFVSQVNMELVEKHWAANPVSAAELSVKQGVEAIAARVQFVGSVKGEVCAWLGAQ